MRHTKRTPIEVVLRPFQEFAAREASGGIVLVLATLAALALANLGGAEGHRAWLDQPVGLEFGRFSERASWLHWINDGLMAVFFLVVGLEIKRELTTGELSSPKQAMLPMAAALGGMVVPAGLFLAFNATGPDARGWGVPMATDIAFALGVLAILGNRIPIGLKVFLAALAIVDDIGAVLVIALFYSGGVDQGYLLGAVVCLIVMAAGNGLGVRQLGFYLILGVALWWHLHHSGLHATLAGVLTAFMVPARSRIDSRGFVERAHRHLEGFETAPSGTKTLTEEHESSLRSLERSIERVTTPVQRLIHHAHPWVAFAIVPLFAFANSGITVTGDLAKSLGQSPMALGIAIGLVVGKPLGIGLFTWLAVKLGIATLPEGVTGRHILGAGLLGGIGFTMAIFISSLAFPDPSQLETAKLAILGSSMIAGIAGYLVLRLGQRKVARA